MVHQVRKLLGFCELITGWRIDPETGEYIDLYPPGS